MTPADLEVYAKRVFGSRVWRIRLRERWKCDQSTIWRYLHGKRKIPGWVERDLLLLIKEHKLARVTKLLGMEKPPKVNKPRKKRA